MSAFDLIAEERIREAIRAGVFDNLPGAGKQRRAMAKLALIEADLEARGLKLSVAPDYFSLIADRLQREGVTPESVGCP